MRRGKANRRRRPGLEALESRVTPTTFRVNTILDTIAVNLKTGKDATGHVSLRSAIEAANAHPGTDKILLPAGTFRLTIAGANEDASASGDLDIAGPLNLQGAGTDSTIIDGNNLDRVIQVLGGQVSLTRLTIQHGHVVGAGGGGILNSGGDVTLSSVKVFANEADGLGGGNGIDGAGGSTGAAGGAGGASTAGQGGGIFNSVGSVRLVSSAVLSNHAIGGVGGAGGRGGFGSGASGIQGVAGGAGNGGVGGAGGDGADGQGGGIFNAAGARVVLQGATIASNQAQGGDGGAGGAGGGALGGHGGRASDRASGQGGGCGRWRGWGRWRRGPRGRGGDLQPRRGQRNRAGLRVLAELRGRRRGRNRRRGR